MCAFKESGVWRIGYRRLRLDKGRADRRLSRDVPGRQKAAGTVLHSGRRPRQVLVLLVSEINCVTVGSNTLLSPKLLNVNFTGYYED